MGPMSPNWPTATELVEAVREFLERDVLPAVEGRVQFHTRVAVNVLGMVERELTAGPAQAAAHAAGLDALGMADEAELAAAIRVMSPDDTRLDDIARFVRDTARTRLEIANPKYFGDDAHAARD